MAIGGVELFEDVMPEDYLELSSGITVKNLKELALALKRMSKDNFSLHVTKSRNDFAEWILEAYNNEKLTKKLIGATDRGRILRILDAAIKDSMSKRPTMINIPSSKKNTLKILGEIDNGGM